jgi:hypothetical protein
MGGQKEEKTVDVPAKVSILDDEVGPQLWFVAIRVGNFSPLEPH